MIYTNMKMTGLLNKINHDKVSKKGFETAHHLDSPIFIEVEKCVLIKDINENIRQLNMNQIYELYGDKTGFEASNNHIHIPKYDEENEESQIKLLKLAMHILDEWKAKLKTDFPTYRFHLIISYDGEECTLRFHKYREEEGSWLKIHDLDGYKEEAILVMEI